MVTIEKIDNIHIIKNSSKNIVEFYEDKMIIHSIDNSIDKNEFDNLIKNTSLKNLEIFTTIFAEEIDKINFLLKLGFNFSSIIFDYCNNKEEEIYSYKFKENLYIKDNVLEEILNKIEKSNL